MTASTIDRIASIFLFADRLFAIAALGGCLIALVSATAAHATDPGFVRLERFRDCPLCVAYTIAVYEDGRVEYQGRRPAKMLGPEVSRVTSDTALALFSRSDSLQFFSLSDHYDYEPGKGRALPKLNDSDYFVQLEIAVRGKSKRVKFKAQYAHEYFPALLEFAREIDNVTASEQWICPLFGAGSGVCNTK